MTTLLPSQVNREEKVEVYVDGRIFSGWEDVDIGVSLGQGARSFRLNVSGEVAETIPVESEVIISIGGDQVVAGVIDQIEDSVSNKSHTISLVGRSKVGQIVDCSAAPTTFINDTVQHIASRLSAPYGVEVVSEVADERTATFRVQPGETVWAAVERSVRDKYILLTDDEQGRLVMTRAGATGTDGDARPLVYGQNIISRTFRLDWSQRFKNYRVNGQGMSQGDVFHRQTGAVVDDSVRQERTLLLVGGTQQPGVTAANRAAWEKQVRIGKSISYNAVVQGWRDASGALWKPNTMAAVWDRFQAWEGAALLIASVNFRLGNDGATTTSLGLGPRQGYEGPEQTTARRRRGVIQRSQPLGIGTFGGFVYDRFVTDEITKAAVSWMSKNQKKDLE